MRPYSCIYFLDDFFLLTCHYTNIEKDRFLTQEEEHGRRKAKNKKKQNESL